MAGVRPYQPGDPLARIHWRASARTGQLHSKVYEASSIAGLTLLVDFHRDSFEARHEPVRSELTVESKRRSEFRRREALRRQACDLLVDAFCVPGITVHQAA